MDGCMTWWSDLESILEDASALEAFKEWFKEDGTRLTDSIDLYFAIKAFRNLVGSNDSKCAEIACKIHRKYISMRSGTCTFLPDTTRREMSERIHALSANKLPHDNLFEPCQEELLVYLRKQHALFVNSDHFSNLLNQNAELIKPMAPSVSDENDPTVYSTGCHACASTSDDISTRLGGRNSVWKKGKQPKRNVVVQNVSKRDSRDSISCSAVSSEDSGNKRSGSKRHSERLPLQRVHGHQQQALLTCPPDGSDFKHQRPEERERFSEILCCKLDKIAYRLEQYKHETGIEVFARELEQLALTTEGSDEVDSVISNDSLDKYEQRMNAECDLNSKEEKRRSISTSPIRFTNTLHVDNVPNPYGRHGFAPPPGGVTLKNCRNCVASRELHSFRSTTPLSGNDYGGHRYSDSSGFCSSESANIINRAALFEKARHIAMSTQTASFPQSCSEASTSSFYYYSFPLEQEEKRPMFVNNFHTKKRQLAISYKEENAEAPFVAKLEMHDITFREFRRCFGISSKTTRRFFFKSECEDCSAPYQWTIIDDDCAILPIFEGRITAECRSCSESD
uniref:RGS domain-containing protein n=1 Tax=Elaeophora elaphi TaxID=1147741 RepID=A0A0R3S718_9BILA